MPNKLGIVAGGQEYPRKIIDLCRQQDRDFCVLALEGQTDFETTENTDHTWVHFGEIGKALKFLHSQDVKEVIFAGNVERPSLSEVRPDFVGMKWLARVSSKALGDDSLLSAIGEELEKEGFKIIGSQDLFKGDDFFMEQGTLSVAAPSEQNLRDIKRGQEVLKTLSPLDVGQAVVIQQGIVLGIEAIEGTQGLVERCGALRRSGERPVLVKTSKEEQDKRFDLPTIGPATIQQAVEAGLAGLALQANDVQIIQKQKVIDLADENGLFLVGV